MDIARGRALIFAAAVCENGPCLSQLLPVAPPFDKRWRDGDEPALADFVGVRVGWPAVVA